MGLLTELPGVGYPKNDILHLTVRDPVPGCEMVDEQFPCDPGLASSCRQDQDGRFVLPGRIVEPVHHPGEQRLLIIMQLWKAPLSKHAFFGYEPVWPIPVPGELLWESEEIGEG